MTEAHSYSFNSDLKIWLKPFHGDFAYSDGAATEYRLLTAIRQCRDVSSTSEELRAHIVDWPSEYHLSPLRHNLLRPFPFRSTDRILELGCGCGSITRYIGESGATVVAVEGSRRRASIAAERCRDLSNVSVYCDNLTEFETDQQFDIVTLIGVLEYSPMFIEAEDPVQACIEKARSFLVKGGTLIVAIENQLGLKYLSGCEEDHTGKPMFGVQGLYGPDTPVTLGKRALEARLRTAGFETQDFYYPFPDYKVPSIIVSEAATKHSDLRVADLLARTVGGERSGKYRTFHEHLAWHPIAENGLLTDLANSFLIFAQSAQNAPNSSDWLAVSYGTGRSNRHWTKTTIFEEGTQLRVRKQALLDPAPDRLRDAQPGTFRHQPSDSQYIQGELLVTGLWRMLANGATADDIGSWLSPWIDFLHARVVNGPHDSTLNFDLPGEYIDCTPFNLLSTAEGKLVYIDAEWRSVDPIPALWVVVRGLLYSLYGFPVPPKLANIESREFISNVLARVGKSVTESEWEKVCLLENAFESFVDGRSRLSQFEKLLSRPLGSLAPILSTPQAYAELIIEKASVERRLVAANAVASNGVTAATIKLIASLTKMTEFARRNTRRSARIARILAKAMLALARHKNRLKILSRALDVASARGISGLQGLFLQFANVNTSYDKWIMANDRMLDSDRGAIRTHISILPSRPLISVLMPVYNTPERWLRNAIESVRTQLYPHWELCIADDASTVPHVRGVLDEYSRIDERIRVTYREKNGHISAASNSALALAHGEFVALLDHDDELAPHALYMVAVALNEKSSLDMIYSDEDKIDESGRRFGHYFKPDWNPDLLTAQNMFSHLGVYRSEIVRAVGGFREGYEGSQDWDLALRVSERIPAAHIHHIPHVLYHWRAISGSTALGYEEKAYVLNASQKAVDDHLRRLGRSASTQTAFSSFVRAQYALPAPAPMVSIIFKAVAGSDLSRCLGNLAKSTRYPNVEVLVVGEGPGEMRSHATGVGFALRFVPHNGNSSSRAAAANQAARSATGSVLVFLNPELMVVNEDWLSEIVSHASRSEIGVVGAMLLTAQKRIYCAAPILVQDSNDKEMAKSFYQNYMQGEKGYGGRAALVQNVSVVHPDCLVLRKEVFEAVGGMDETAFPAHLAGLDLCLRVGQRGFRNLWTPYAELCFGPDFGSHQSAQDDPGYLTEAAYFRDRWQDMLTWDPSNNPNLAAGPYWPYLAASPRAVKPWQR